MKKLIFFENTENHQKNKFIDNFFLRGASLQCLWQRYQLPEYLVICMKNDSQFESL